jgi:competence protein ComQ
VYVRQVLSVPGKLLGPDEGFVWGLLPLLVCEAAGGDPRRGLSLAAAFDCFIAAADVFDDIQDDDDDAGLQRIAGPATAINVAAFLLFLSQHALGRLEVPSPTVTQLFELFAATGMKAYGGQQLDIDYTFAKEVTEARYLEMVARKSGTLAACGCRAGALLAGSHEQTLTAYSRFGCNLGIALQIANDVRGAVTRDPARGDLRAGKPTLPLIYALNHAPKAERAALAEIVGLARRGMLEPTDLEQAYNLLRKIGALEYTTVFIDLYWEHALTCLRQAGCAEDSLLFDLLKHLRGD